MQNTSDQIYFNFSYFALKLLGKGLYSNPWTAISELVANGFDAKAKKVKILLDMSIKKQSSVEILDNGYGMGYEDLAEKYTLIGKNKREDYKLDFETKQNIMGRKGIGKLAALYLSNKFYLISKTKEEQSAWMLDLSSANDSDIPSLQKINIADIPIICSSEWEKNQTGTLIKLVDVDLTNIGVQTIEGIKARLADFYLTDSLDSVIEIAIKNTKSDSLLFTPVKKSIAYKNFFAFFNNSNFLPNLSQSVYISSPVGCINDKKRPVQIISASAYETAGKRKFKLEDGNLMNYELPYSMEGWIGIHTSIKQEDAARNDPEYLKNKAYRPNQLRLYVRKKLAVENFLEYVKNTQAFANYIEGEISFDILDHNDLEDISTSNRQDFLEDNERVQLLIEILKPIITGLIGARSRVGTQVRSEENAYYEEKERKQQELAERAERDRLKQQEAAEKAIGEKEHFEKKASSLEQNLAITKEVLGSEQKRSSYLFNALSQDQLDFEKRFHQIRINLNTIKGIITIATLKHNRNKLDYHAMWDSIKKISFYIERVSALLDIAVAAKFDAKDERITNNLFLFIEEYCREVLASRKEMKIKVETPENRGYIREFSPQDIIVVLENIVSNSIKHNAKELIIKMTSSNNINTVSFIDNGAGLDKNIVDCTTLFEFGRSYTRAGTGVGLYHIKNIIDDMGGTIIINSQKKNGFEIKVVFKNAI